MIAFSPPSIAILQHPKSQVVAAGQAVPGVSFNCSVKGEQTEWIVNGEQNTVERNKKLIDSGVLFSKNKIVEGMWTSTITIPSTKTFNVTRIKCNALNVSLTLASSEAVMTIAGIYVWV